MPSATPLIVIVTCVTGVGVGAGVGAGVGTSVGVGAGVGAGPGVPPGEPMGGSGGVGSGRGAGGSVGVDVGEGAGVGFGAGVGVETATGGVLVTGDDELPPQPETGSVDARTTNETRPPSGRPLRKGRDEAGARRPRPIVSTPCPGSSSG